MKEKSLDKRRNTSIHRMESKGKFWINLFKKKIRKRSHNAAFSESKNSFSDQVKTFFFFT